MASCCSRYKQLPAEAAAQLEGENGRGRNWALVYVGDGRCDEDCKRALVFARQTRLSLGKDMSRVNRALVATASCCDLAYIDKEHQGTKVFDVSDQAAAKELLDALPGGDLRNFLFIIDPLGTS